MIHIKKTSPIDSIKAELDKIPLSELKISRPSTLLKESGEKDNPYEQRTGRLRPFEEQHSAAMDPGGSYELVEPKLQPNSKDKEKLEEILKSLDHKSSNIQIPDSDKD